MKAIQGMNNQSAGKYELKLIHLNLSHLKIFGMHFQLHYQLQVYQEFYKSVEGKNIYI